MKISFTVLTFVEDGSLFNILGAQEMLLVSSLRGHILPSLKH